MTVNEKISALRELMKRDGIDLFYVTTGDYHCSEYVSDYFKVRDYLSGFTGSNGDLIVTMEEAILWTDGRYFIQAEEELAGSEIQLYKMGEPGVPKVSEFIKKSAMEGIGISQEKLDSESLDNKTLDAKNYKISFDGRVVSAEFLWNLRKNLSSISTISNGNANENSSKFKVQIDSDSRIADELWEGDSEEERPLQIFNPIYEYDIKYCGEERKSKLKRVHDSLPKGYKNYAHVVASLDDINWLLNIRGEDIHCNPVAFSFLILDEENTYLFANLGETNKDKSGNNIREHLESDGVQILPYEKFYDFLSEKSEVEYDKIFLDMKNINAATYDCIKDKKKIFNMPNPEILMKAVKNVTEQKNSIEAHVKDGVAITKLLYWLKKICKVSDDKKYLLDENGEIVTEISVSDKLEEVRWKCANYTGPSFDTISGSGEHSAIIHYSADEKTNIPLVLDDFLLLDMGGQYLEGTTDITRTVFVSSIGENREKSSIDNDRKRFYTFVLRGHLNLAYAKFLKGCSGVALDILARKPLWDLGLDFKHGTGHGVGHFLNVHESPNGFRYRILQGTGQNPELQPGMITSDEPGIYFGKEAKEQYGIRIENLILCEERETNPYGTFYGFRNLTLVPYEREAIDISLMTEQEIGYLNDYHKKVLETIGPKLEDDERAWLEEVCREFVR